MLPFEDRYTRQRQLREVGLLGQQRLEASVVHLGPSLADRVAADYLARAGVRVERCAESASDCAEVVLARAVCDFDGPRDYLAGALVALNHVRAVLGLASNPPVLPDETRLP